MSTNTTYMTEQERADVNALLHGIDELPAEKKNIALGIMIGMRLAEAINVTPKEA